MRNPLLQTKSLIQRGKAFEHAFKHAGCIQPPLYFFIWKWEKAPPVAAQLLIDSKKLVGSLRSWKCLG